jgi:hypothetical protein
MRALVILALAAAVAAAGDPEPVAEWATVEGRHIVLEVHAADLQVLDDPRAWVARLDRVYEALADLVGDVPFGGAKIRIRSDEDPGGAWARAGNPITWRRSTIAPSFRDHVNKGDWLFGIVHEISHDFDLDGRWVWEAEIMANFKMDYVFEKVKGVAFLRGRVCDYGDPDGLRLTDVYRENERARTTSTKVLGGGWDRDPYHRMLATLVARVGWEPIRRAFRWMNTLDRATFGEDRLAKRSLFLRAIDDQTPVDVQAMFVDWGFGHLAVDLRDPKAAARCLRDRDWNAVIAERPIAVSESERATVRVETAVRDPLRVARGLGTHAPSEIVFDLGGRYDRFESLIGVPGPIGADGNGTVTFAVDADGRRVFESGLVRGGGPCREVSVDVSGVRRLTLVVGNAGDGQSCDEAAWGNARLTNDAGAVTWLSSLAPVSARQGYGKLGVDTDLGGNPIVFPYRPLSDAVQVEGKLHGERVRFRRVGRTGAYECTLGRLPVGEHLLRLRIRAGNAPVTQHELVAIRVRERIAVMPFRFPPDAVDDPAGRGRELATAVAKLLGDGYEVVIGDGPVDPGDREEALRAARDLRARRLVAGEVLVVDGGFRAGLSLVNARSGQWYRQVTARTSCGSEDRISTLLPAAAWGLGLVTKRPVRPEPRAGAGTPDPGEREKLFEQLLQPDRDMRFGAIVELGREGRREALRRLVVLLAKDGDPFVRRRAAWALGELDAWNAVPPLIDALASRDYFVALAAHVALVKIAREDFGFRDDSRDRKEIGRIAKRARDWWDEHRHDRDD